MNRAQGRGRPDPPQSRRLAVALAAVFGAVCAVASGARADPWQPSPGHEQTPIWPGTPPDAAPNTNPEACCATSVSRPTMTVYAPQGANTGAAVVVFPGGGYQVLAMDLEGTEICDWLVSRGITCVLLKYRVPNSGPTMLGGHRYYPPVQTALQDAQRTLRLVRRHAAAWHVDPHRVGVIGFSAGGHLAAAVSTRFAERTYPPVDAADALSSRPDFAMVVYPGHLWIHEDEDRATRNQEDLRLRADIRVTAETPPTFVLHAENDGVDTVEQSLAYYVALQRAGAPAELHLYAQGGHAFGLRATNLPVRHWTELAEQWLRAIGMFGTQEPRPFRSAAGAGASPVPVPGLDGTWEGALDDQATDRGLVLHISSDATGTSATLDSPDRPAFGLPIQRLRRDGQHVEFTLPATGSRYAGTLSADGLTLSGAWARAGGPPRPSSFARALPARPGP